MSTARVSALPKPRCLELHILVPGVVLLFFLADLGLRFVPPKYVAFRCWEEMTVSPIAEGPFVPSAVCRVPRASGDLSSLGNLPALRQYKSEVFTTDRWGYRNPPDPLQRPISILLVGDSFGAGCGVTDTDTLSVQLEKLGHVGVYNAAGAPISGRGVEALIKRLSLKGALIIWQQSERFDPPQGIDHGVEAEHSEVRLAGYLFHSHSRADRAFQAMDRFARARYAYSPLKIWLRRAFSHVRNAMGLPNLSAQNVVELRLKNGQPMIFLPADVYGEPERTGAEFFVQLKALIESFGDRLLVVLVPDKYKVYYPLVSDPIRAPADEKTYMGALARNLKAAGVPVLNLTSKLRAQAAAAFVRGKYNYMIDDTHWNALGIEESACEILRTTGITAAQQDAGTLHARWRSAPP